MEEKKNERKNQMSWSLCKGSGKQELNLVNIYVFVQKRFEIGAKLLLSILVRILFSFSYKTLPWPFQLLTTNGSDKKEKGKREENKKIEDEGKISGRNSRNLPTFYLCFNY